MHLQALSLLQQATLQENFSVCGDIVGFKSGIFIGDLDSCFIRKSLAIHKIEMSYKAIFSATLSTPFRPLFCVVEYIPSFSCKLLAYFCHTLKAIALVL